MNITYQEVRDTVDRVQSQIPELAGMKDEQQTVTALIATLAARSVLELLERKPSSIVSFEEDNSPFPMVFAEWANNFTLKTHFERFLAIMLWLREKEQQNEVSTSDLTRMYEKARWKKPANFADVFAKGAEKLFFAESEADAGDGLKQWRMTRTGYEYIKQLEV